MSDRKYGSSRITEIVIEDPAKCFVCGNFVPADSIECPSCNFPQNGDDASQRWFLGQLRVTKRERNYAGFAVEKAYAYLASLPIIFLLIAALFWQGGHILYAQITLLIGMTFLSIWIFGHKNPRRAFIASLCLYGFISVPLMCLVPRIILATKFFIFAPYIFLWIGIGSYKDLEVLDKEIGDKNSG